MSMSIGSTAAISGTQGTSNGNAVGQQRRQAFQQLAQALQRGDLNAAQSAYGTLSSLRGGGRRNDGDADDQGGTTTAGGTTASSSSQGNGNSPFAQLGQALQSGDLQAAQQAFQAMGHHGHHHGHGSQQTTASQQVTSTQTQTSDSDTLGSNVNITV